MDGPIDNGSITIRSGDMPTGLLAIKEITGITPYITMEDYSSRIMREQCDNGGIIDSDGRMHGCDEFCQIIDGWTCTHYYHHLIQVEYPVFTSYCELDSTRRRLSPLDFDKHGRLLHHVAFDSYKQALPANTHEMRNDKMRLHFSTTFGTNGQLRLVESTGTDETVFGFMYA